VTASLETGAVMDLVNDIERRFDVAAWRAHDVAFWPLVRVALFLRSDRHYAGHAIGVPGGALRGLVSRAARLAGRAAMPLRAHIGERLDRLADPAGAERLSGPADVAFLSDGVSFARVAGRWYERLCDPLREDLLAAGRSSVLLVPGPGGYRPRWSRALDVHAALALASVRSLLRRGYRPPDGETLREVAEAARLARAAGADAAPLSPAWIRRGALRVAELTRAFERVLRVLRPRLGAVVSYYGDEGMAFLRACRRLGIPSADLQHGVQGELHVAYGRWPSAPEGGWELLPSVFWCWSEVEASAVRAWAGEAPGAPHKAWVGGNPMLERWRASGGPPEVRERVLAAARAAPGRANVLVTLQPGFAASPFRAILVAVARDLGPAARIWARLHPCMLVEREEVRAALRDAGDVEIDLASDLPLYGLLPHLDAHLTTVSSVVIEAADFGLRSVATDPSARDFFAREVASGALRIAEDAPGAAAAIREALRAGRLEPRGVSAQGIVALLDALGRAGA
jgi:hypothetical protein